MNPLTNTKNINKLNERELALGIKQTASWHNQYRDSAWVFIGGLPYDLTEGDILCVFSQYGEIVNVNLVRDRKTGKPKGFCFLCYEDQRSTILAVDNLNGIKILGRTVRVDHVASYKPPKEHDDHDEVTKALHKEGCAPKTVNTEMESSRTPSPLPPPIPEKKVKLKKKKKKKDKKHKKDKKRRHHSSYSDEDSDCVAIKAEVHDPEYDKHLRPQNERYLSPIGRRETSKIDYARKVSPRHHRSPSRESIGRTERKRHRYDDSPDDRRRR